MAASCQHIALLILSSVMLLSSVTDAVLTMDQTCQLYNEGYIADPSNCANWGYCRGGQVAAKGTCSAGLLYDNKLAECVYANNTVCAYSAATMCDNQNAVFRTNPNDCTSYCYCEASKNSGCMTCPNKQVFNPNINQCVWGSTYNCPIDSACYLVSNNQFVADPDPANCGNYLRCVGGASEGSKACSSGIFNPSNGKCDTVTTMNCTGVDAPDVVLTQAQITAICAPFVAPTAPATEVYYADTVSCGGYVACESASKGTWQKCPFATHFDETTQQCVSPITSKCTYDRCNNLNLGFVTAPGTLCASYFACQGQKSLSTTPSTCEAVSPDYPYFDEIAGGCVATLPGYDICAA